MTNKAQLCPVCKGKGKVIPGFYSDEGGINTGATTCRSCNGDGYVVISGNKSQVASIDEDGGLIRSTRLYD